MYDLVIVGGGPAGIAAGVYASRKKMKTAIITDSFGGQSLVSAAIQNWIGMKSVSGFELGKMLEEHLRAQEDIEIIDGDLAASVKKQGSFFELATQGGKILQSKTVLIATGSRYRKLNVPGEEKFEGKGISNCSTCDAPLFKDKEVAVVGGGNSGLEAVVDLIPYASKIYLVHRSGALKGDPVTEEKIKANPKVHAILNAEVMEISGDGDLKGLRYKDKISGETVRLQVQGVFVKVGLVPNSGIVGDLVKLNEWGEIVVDHRTGATSADGVWAAGDVTNALYKQNNISVGDAIKGVLSAYAYLKKGR